jgi:hypothetical protein
MPRLAKQFSFTVYRLTLASHPDPPGPLPPVRLAEGGNNELAARLITRAIAAEGAVLRAADLQQTRLQLPLLCRIQLRTISRHIKDVDGLVCFRVDQHDFDVAPLRGHGRC